MSALEHELESELPADAVEKLGFFGGLLVTQKIDLHNRSVLNDCILGNIKPTPKIGPKKIGFRVFQHNRPQPAVQVFPP